jgi:uncharacterized protein (TIGR03435 family)
MDAQMPNLSVNQSAKPHHAGPRLAERFHLAAHREEKSTAVWALEIGKGPLKLHEVKADEHVSPSGCIHSYGSSPAG